MHAVPVDGTTAAAAFVSGRSRRSFTENGCPRTVPSSNWEFMIIDCCGEIGSPLKGSSGYIIPINN